MIIVNADDWGRSQEETDAALACYLDGRITSTTAMVFMADSARAAEIAKDLNIHVGLHLNFSEHFSGAVKNPRLIQSHDRIVRYISSSRFAGLIYNPALMREFDYDFRAQYEEFVRLHGRRPSHIDGHHHQHLCANVVLGGILPEGEKVRRSFHFWPGEKGLGNRVYRRILNMLLARRHPVTDFFFALSQSLDNRRLARIAALAQKATVEIMTHPVAPTENAFLLGDEHLRFLAPLKRGTYGEL